MHEGQGHRHERQRHDGRDQVVLRARGLQDSHGEGGREDRGERTGAARRAEGAGKRRGRQRGQGPAEELNAIGEPIGVREHLRHQQQVLGARRKDRLLVDEGRVDQDGPVEDPVRDPGEVVRHAVPGVGCILSAAEDQNRRERQEGKARSRRHEGSRCPPDRGTRRAESAYAMNRPREHGERRDLVHGQDRIRPDQMSERQHRQQHSVPAHQQRQRYRGGQPERHPPQPPDHHQRRGEDGREGQERECEPHAASTLMTVADSR